MKTVKAWHFLPENRRLTWGSQRVVRPGEWRSCQGSLAVCSNGMHGSRRLIDALTYAPGPIVCRTEHAGEIIEQPDKLCSRKRRVIWMADASRTLHLFACLCAEDALALIDEPDPRSLQAIRAKRLWLDGKISDDQLNMAREAARAVAWGVAWGAAWGAAWAAAWGVAWGAAREAAGWEAARGAARHAASTVAWDAGWGAVRTAARDAQNRRLVRMVNAIRVKDRA